MNGLVFIVIHGSLGDMHRYSNACFRAIELENSHRNFEGQ